MNKTTKVIAIVLVLGCVGFIGNKLLNNSADIVDIINIDSTPHVSKKSTYFYRPLLKPKINSTSDNSTPLEKNAKKVKTSDEDLKKAIKWLHDVCNWRFKNVTLENGRRVKKLSFTKHKVVRNKQITLKHDGFFYLSKLSSLENLNFSCTSLLDDELTHLIDLPLKSLNLFGTSNITDKGLISIGHIKTLNNLDLGCTKITDEGLEHLKNLSSLKTLDLSYTKVTDSGMVKLQSLLDLKELHLEGAAITDEGLKNVGTLQSLEKLFFNSKTITDEGLIALQGLTNLKVLQCYNTNITDKGFRDFKKNLPNCKIVIEYIPNYGDDGEYVGF